MPSPLAGSNAPYRFLQQFDPAHPCQLPGFVEQLALSIELHSVAGGGNTSHAIGLSRVVLPMQSSKDQLRQYVKSMFVDPFQMFSG